MSDIWGGAPGNSSDRKEEPVEFWNTRERNLFGNKFKGPVLCKPFANGKNQIVTEMKRVQSSAMEIMPV